MPAADQYPQPWNSVPKSDIFDLVGSDGLPNGKRISESLGFNKKDTSHATGIERAKIRYDKKMPKELRKRLTEWATAINLVGSFFNDYEKTMAWFQTPNYHLGNIPPASMIKAGRYNRLVSFIQSSLEGNLP